MTGERVAVEAGASATPSAARGWLAARLVAAGLVVALLSLLVWDLAHETSGSNFVEKIAQGKRPAAPAFDRPIVWDHSETWP
jgi:hypothetical protein